MPAHGFEADEALEEGVKIRWLTTIKEIVGPSLTVERMALDDNGPAAAHRRVRHAGGGQRRPGPGPGRPTAGSCAALPGVEAKRDGTVVVDRHMMTGHPGLFAGGDMVPSERTVTVAVGHGKQAARNIDAWLRGAAYDAPAAAATR